MYENINYVIFDVSELEKIYFSQVLETSAETVRKSVDGTKTFVKWYHGGTAPTCVESLTTKGNYLTHAEILVILADPEWTAPMELI